MYSTYGTESDLAWDIWAIADKVGALADEGAMLGGSELYSILTDARAKILDYMKRNHIEIEWWPGWREETRAKCIKIIEEGTPVCGAIMDVICAWIREDPEVRAAYERKLASLKRGCECNNGNNEEATKNDG